MHLIQSSTIIGEESPKSILIENLLDIQDLETSVEWLFSVAL